MTVYSLYSDIVSAETLSENYRRSPRLHLYIHEPVAVFKARVNMPTVTYPVTTLTFDTVTLGAFGDIEFDATLLLGTAEGLDDLGRVRVKSDATSTTIPISRASRGIEDGTLNVQDNAYITVLDDFRVWAKLPYFKLDENGDIDDGIDYKDGDVPVGDYNTELPPVANTGPGFADYIDPETEVITVEFPKGGLDLSFPMADGATIATYAWEVKDGTITVGTSASAVITATFPAGFRYVALTVVDSNGKPHTARCPVLAVDPAADVTQKYYQVTQRLEKKGQTLDIKLHSDLARTVYPDGTLVMFWWDAPDSPDSRSHMKFIGWIQNENFGISRSKLGVARTTNLHCVDVAGRLESLPGFPQALERVEADSQWSYMPTLDMRKSLWYLAFWHSTALNVADFILPDALSDYIAMRLDANGSNLFDQVNSQAMKLVPDHYLTCNSQGQMVVQRDWMLDDVGDRPTAAPIITEDYWQSLEAEYNRAPKIHVLRSGAFLATEDFVTIDGQETLPLVFSIAPGDASAFGQGLQEHTENEGLALSQEDLNKHEGHRYALLNARFGNFTLKDPNAFDFWDYEPALFNRVQLNISATVAAQRGLPFTQINTQIQDISITYATSKKGTSIQPTVTLIKEESGFPAMTYVPPDSEEVGYTPPPAATPPDDGLTTGQDLVAGIGTGSLYRTADFTDATPTWAEVALTVDGDILSWVVDPFSPGYISGVGAINGWVVSHAEIVRVEDIFGTTSCTTVHTFAEDIPAEGWRTIQASFGDYYSGAYPWLLCVSYYGDTVGHTGTWALRSVDGGTTWAETEVSAFYDTALATPQPIGVYTSPKTPGLAYTAAYIETATPAESVGYISEDWGETWTIFGEAVDDPAAPLVQFAIWDGSTITDAGLGASSSVTSTATDAGGPAVTVDKSLWIVPAANVKRIAISGTWYNSYSSPTGINCSSNNDVLDATSTTLTDDLVHTPPPGAAEASASGSFTAEVTFPGFATGDFPVNRSNYTTASNSNAFRVRCYAGANGFGASPAVSINTVTVLVTEVELDDGTIYTPSNGGAIQTVHGQAGAIHIPWPTNPLEDIMYYGTADRDGTPIIGLNKAVAGVSSDISADTTYGVEHGHFSIRTFDSDRTYAVLGGSDGGGNSGVWVSDNEGATWTEVVTPSAVTPYQAAFSGDDRNRIYIWGPATYFGYSDDFGVTVDDKSGNLAALSATKLIGICGGPTP